MNFATTNQRQTPVQAGSLTLTVIWADAILDGLKTFLDFRSTLMTEGSITVNRQHIPARLVQHPQFSIGIALEPTAMQDASQIEDKTCGTCFWLYRY